jgi:hypothetical protein
MLTILHDLPPHVVGIKATGKVTKEECDRVMIPAIDGLVARTGKINYLLLIETDVSNFTLGALMDDLAIGVKHFNRWNKIAVVTDQKSVERFSDVFGMIAPGQSKGFAMEELVQAKTWISS